MQIDELARAKINLCLHITGQRDDGYHLLDSIVTFADIGDNVSVIPNDGFSLVVKGPYADGVPDGDDNLVLKAARIYADKCDGAAVTLTKNLPVASGIGGGSADAAATLRAMARMTGAALPDDSGLSLGADVPVCLRSETCLMQGIGEEITTLPDFSGFHAVLACPDVRVATSDIFNMLNNKRNTPIENHQAGQSIDKYLSGLRNDLEAPSMQETREIGHCIDGISQQGAFLARMSGSGATCFGLFKGSEQARLAAKALAAHHPDWWISPCRLGVKPHG